MPKVLLILLAWALVFGPDPAASAPKKKSAAKAEQVFRAIYPAEPRSLDPHGPADPAAWPVIMACYHRLVTLKAGTAEPQPALARRVVVSPDGLKYTFILNEGLTFSDGTAVNSEAVLYSFDRLMSASTGRLYFPHLKSFEMVGPYTFRMILSRPWPPFLASLALPQASLVSPGLKQKPPNYLAARTLGSGRYQVYDWKNSTIGLRARPDLTVQPKVVFAMFHFEPDGRRRYEKMVAHGAHFAVDPTLPPEGPGVQYQSLRAPSFGARLLAFNTRRPFTSSSVARRALARAAETAFQSHPDRLAGPFPPGLFYNAPARAEAPELGQTDPLAQARLVLVQNPPPAPLTLVHAGEDPSLAADARTLARTLEAFGAPVAIVPLSGAPGRRQLETGDYDLYLGDRTADVPAADMWLGRLLDGRSTVDGNPALFSRPEAERLILEIADTVGRPNEGPNDLRRVESERASKLDRLAQIAGDEAPYAFLYQLTRPLVLDVRLAGLGPHPQWPEVWPLDQTDLKPFSFRSGVNPAGRPPAPKTEAAPPRRQIPGPSRPEPPPAPAETAPELPRPAPDAEPARPDIDDFIGLELD